MASSFAALEDMVQRTMSRVQRNEEDMTAIGNTVAETHEDVRDLKLYARVFKGNMSTLGADVRVLKQDVGKLKVDVSGLKHDVVVVKQDVSGLKQDMIVVKQDVSGLKQDMVIVKQDVSGLKENVDEFKHDVRRDMGWVKRAVQALMTHQGVAVEPDDTDD